MTTSHRNFKDRLYAEFAVIGKALNSAHRLEILDLLAQGERSVEELAKGQPKIAHEGPRVRLGATGPWNDLAIVILLLTQTNDKRTA